MIEKSDFEPILAKIPIEYAQRIRNYAEANSKCEYEVIQNILIKGAKEL